jgi:hypothetical protein
LGHLELTRDHFASAVDLKDARASWGNFLRPEDSIAVYNHGTARLLRHLSDEPAPLVLKACDFNPRQRYSTLDELLAGEALVPGPASHPGRAGKRLANAVALVRHLAALGNSLKATADSRANSPEFDDVG